MHVKRYRVNRAHNYVLRNIITVLIDSVIKLIKDYKQPNSVYFKPENAIICVEYKLNKRAIMFLRISLLGSVNRLLKQILLEGSVLTAVILGTPTNSVARQHNDSAAAVQSAGSAFC